MNNISLTPLYIIAQILGLLGVTSCFIAFQQKSRRGLLTCKLTADICWTIHYIMLGAFGGMIPNIVAIGRELVFINRDEKKWANNPIWVVIFIAFNWVLNIITWQNWYCVLPALASSAFTIALWLKNTLFTKTIGIFTCIGYFIYNMLVGSIAGIVCNLIEVSSLIIFFIRYFAEKRKSTDKAAD